MNEFAIKFNGRTYTTPMSLYKCEENNIINNLTEIIEKELSSNEAIKVTVVGLSDDKEEIVDTAMNRSIMLELRAKGYACTMLGPESEELIISKDKKKKVLDGIFSTGLYMFWMTLAFYLCLSKYLAMTLQNSNGLLFELIKGSYVILNFSLIFNRMYNGFLLDAKEITIKLQTLLSNKNIRESYEETE